MASEPKEEIKENVVNIETSIYSSLLEGVLKPEEELTYFITIDNYEFNEYEDLVITDILPEGIEFKSVVENVDGEDNEIEYIYNEETS